MMRNSANPPSCSLLFRFSQVGQVCLRFRFEVMGKQQVSTRLKEVVYTLSPFEQNVMKGLFTDIPHKVMHHLKQNVLFDALPFCVAPIAAIGWFCADYNEKEKQHHRY